VATLAMSAAGDAMPTRANDAPVVVDKLIADKPVVDKQVPGLLRRYRVVDDAGRAGTLSLWRDATAARQQLDAAAQAAAEWFDTPILLPSTLASNQPRLPGSEGTR
jgi:hypothetical protein